MISRFLGESGKRKLIRAIKECQVFIGNNDAANQIAEVGELLEFSKGQALISQDETDDDLFILIIGEIDILVNGRLVATRKAPKNVGEMCLVNPKAPRSATVTARTPVVALKISEDVFSEVAEEHPELWRNIAVDLAGRLRERGRLLEAPNEIPKLFIGSSVESLRIAEQIQASLTYEPVEVVVWTDNVFLPSRYTLEDLMCQVNESDFALFLVMPEDLIQSRGEASYGPRDNVILEIGLFMGKLGRKRVFLVTKRGENIKLPTDLLGIKILNFNAESSNLSSAVGPVCTEVKRMINKLGAK